MTRKHLEQTHTIVRRSVRRSIHPNAEKIWEKVKILQNLFCIHPSVLQRKYSQQQLTHLLPSPLLRALGLLRRRVRISVRLRAGRSVVLSLRRGRSAGALVRVGLRGHGVWLSLGVVLGVVITRVTTEEAHVRW
jgi:hypothetical protein